VGESLFVCCCFYIAINTKNEGIARDQRSRVHGLSKRKRKRKKSQDCQNPRRGKEVEGKPVELVSFHLMIDAPHRLIILIE
jgi:hypothetical protein